MASQRHRRTWSGALLLASLLSACGGGGGGGSGSGGPKASLAVSPGSLAFSTGGVSAPTPAAQDLVGTISGTLEGTLYVVITGSGQAVGSVSPFVLLGETSGRVSVSPPSPDSVGMGIYSGSVVVQACVNDPTCRTGNLTGSPRTVTVSYTVPGLRAAPSSVNYTLTNTTPDSDLVRQSTITTVPAQNWTASSDQSWLSVTPGGASGASLSLSLVRSRLSGFDNGEYSAVVTVTPSSAGEAVRIPVVLTIRRTQINSVMPYVAYSGTSDSVIVRGEEFGQVTISNVLFGSVPAQSFSRIGPNEIRATYPASLPVGRHTVRFQNDFDGVRQLADLVVVNAPGFAAQALSYPAAVQSAHVNAVVYDAERAALGVSVWNSSSGATHFVRFPSVASSWQPATAIDILNSFGATLSADGTEWIVGAYRAVRHLRASDLAATATIDSPVDGNSSLVLAEFALAGDGRVAMYGDVYFNCGAMSLIYEVRRKRFVSSPYTPCRGNFGASGDGSLLLTLDQFDYFNTDDLLKVDPQSGALSVTGVHQLSGSSPVIDRTGSRIVLDVRKVYDRDRVFLGELPGSTLAVVLSPDGTRAYGYDNSGKLMSYDLTAAPVEGVFAPEGEGIMLAGDPGTAEALFSTLPVMMAITPDARTVFIAGPNGVIVQPVP